MKEKIGHSQQDHSFEKGRKVTRFFHLIQGSCWIKVTHRRSSMPAESILLGPSLNQESEELGGTRKTIRMGEGLAERVDLG